MMQELPGDHCQNLPTAGDLGELTIREGSVHNDGMCCFCNCKVYRVVHVMEGARNSVRVCKKCLHIIQLYRGD